MVLELAKSELVSISGTASIAPDGTSFAPGNPVRQIETTLVNLRAMLLSVGLDFDSRGSWTLYFKDEETWAAWERGVEEGRFPALSGVAIYADICREDLLFEAEVTVVKSRE